jgi:predicted nucleotide-binding protein
MAEWSHSDLDEFLLEVDVPDLQAPGQSGSRRDRAYSIIEYVLANPSAITAERALLSAHILRVAKKRAVPNQTAPHDQSARSPVRSAGKRPEVNNETDTRTPNRVFIVHGQNGVARTSVVNVLKDVGLKSIVLHEQPNMGRHLLTKFIDEADLVTFAIILMTDDDVGGIKGGRMAPRARQNVILELGYFLSHLGQKRVCALITPGLETPSDFDGIVYIRMDDDGSWKRELLRELKAASMPVVE